MDRRTGLRWDNKWAHIFSNDKGKEVMGNHDRQHPEKSLHVEEGVNIGTIGEIHKKKKYEGY